MSESGTGTQQPALSVRWLLEHLRAIQQGMADDREIPSLVWIDNAAADIDRLEAARQVDAAKLLSLETSLDVACGQWDEAALREISLHLQLTAAQQRIAQLEEQLAASYKRESEMEIAWASALAELAEAQEEAAKVAELEQQLAAPRFVDIGEGKSIAIGFEDLLEDSDDE